MKTKRVLNYRIILTPDKRTGSGSACYVASCPTLGVVDDGDTSEEALKNIKETIKFHLESLKKEGKEIPVDRPEEELVANVQIQFASSLSTTKHSNNFAF